DVVEIPDVEAAAPRVTVAGWGTLKEGGGVSPKLMKVDVPLVSAVNCKKSYPNQIDDTMICAGFEAGGQDSCQGDSGGPLYYQTPNGNFVLAGVVSWGRGCARPKYYGVYGNVSSVVEWIETSTAVIEPESGVAAY
ncbi:MAG: serine protease, partial [Bdellovibrionota bacterium]